MLSKISGAKNLTFANRLILELRISFVKSPSAPCFFIIKLFGTVVEFISASYKLVDLLLADKVLKRASH